jgi:hypothetical protein
MSAFGTKRTYALQQKLIAQDRCRWIFAKSSRGLNCLGHVGRADGKIDADAKSDNELAEQDPLRGVSQSADQRADRDDRHVY